MNELEWHNQQQELLMWELFYIELEQLKKQTKINEELIKKENDAKQTK